MSILHPIAAGDARIARYVCRAESADVSLEVAYDGGAPAPGDENPAQTRVTARGMRRANPYVAGSPWIESWVSEYGDLRMPEGAWNGIDLAAITQERAFLGIGTILSEVATNSGATLWEVQTGNTPIYSVMLSMNGELLIVFNGYYGFVDPHGLANIAAYDVTGHEVWRAQQPSPGDNFANRPGYRDDKLEAASWHGWLCTIDDRTGKIIDRRFTK